jgi:ribonuclease III
LKKKGPGLPDEASAALLLGRAQTLGALIGHTFRDWGLLSRALTHPSSSKRDNNQRLEFLGDAVLQLCVSRMLYERFGEGEGGLTRRRQQLVSAGALTRIALTLKLGESVLMDASLIRQGGREHPGVLADALEAVLGAVFLDGGLDAAEAVVRRLWAKALEEADAKLDPKGALQAWAAGKGLSGPAYVHLEQSGPINSPVYGAAVLIGELEMGRGFGPTKRAAQAATAANAMEGIGRPEEHSETGKA